MKSTVTRESGKILLICIETQSGNARGCVSNNKVGISNTAGTCAEPSGSLEGDARPAKAASSSHFSYIYLTHILYNIYNSSMTSTPAERDEQLLSIGKQCSHPACLLVDFLPFKCQHCEDAFCQEHFLVSAHNCTKYDESKHNRVAPNCTCFHFLSSSSTDSPQALFATHLFLFVLDRTLTSGWTNISRTIVQS